MHESVEETRLQAVAGGRNFEGLGFDDPSVGPKVAAAVTIFVENVEHLLAKDARPIAIRLHFPSHDILSCTKGNVQRCVTNREGVGGPLHGCISTQETPRSQKVRPHEHEEQDGQALIQAEEDVPCVVLRST